MLQDLISLLGIANPQLALTWHDGGLPTESAGSPMRLLNSANGEWFAPAAGLLNQAFAKQLSMPNGERPTGTPWVLAIHPPCASSIKLKGSSCGIMSDIRHP